MVLGNIIAPMQVTLVFYYKPNIAGNALFKK